MNRSMNGSANRVVEVEGGSMELTQIRGIGATKKQWLAALGIHTVEALAQVEAEAFRTQLKDLGYTVSRTEIEAWLQQAQAFAPTPLHPDSAAETSDCSSTSTLSTWTTISSFQVEVQTRSIDGTTEKQISIQKLDDHVSHTWSCLNENELQKWILDNIQDECKYHFLPPKKSAHSISSSAQDYPGSIEIVQIRIYQSTTTPTVIVVDATNPFITSMLVIDKPIALELLIKQVDDAIVRSHPLTFHASCQAKHLATGAIVELGHIRITVHPQPTAVYTLRLPEIVLQQPGAYRLMAIASVDDHPAITASFKIPTLQLQSLAPARYQANELPMSCGI